MKTNTVIIALVMAAWSGLAQGKDSEKINMAFDEETKKYAYTFIEDAGIGTTRRASTQMFNAMDEKMQEIIKEVKTTLQSESKKSDW